MEILKKLISLALETTVKVVSKAFLFTTDSDIPCPSVLKLIQLQLRTNGRTVQIKNIPMPEVVDLKAAGYIKSQIHGIAVD